MGRIMIACAWLLGSLCLHAQSGCIKASVLEIEAQPGRVLAEHSIIVVGFSRCVDVPVRVIPEHGKLLVRFFEQDSLVRVTAGRIYMEFEVSVGDYRPEIFTLTPMPPEAALTLELETN